MSQITYKNTVKDIEDFFNSHDQVETVVFADREVFENAKDKNYPFVFIDPAPSGMGIGEMTYSFEISVFDKPQESRADLIEIFSKCFNILSDFRVYITRSELQKYGVDNGDLLPVNKASNDRVTGFSMQFTFSVPGYADRCLIPTE